MLLDIDKNCCGVIVGGTGGCFNLFIKIMLLDIVKKIGVVIVGCFTGIAWGSPYLPSLVRRTGDNKTKRKRETAARTMRCEKTDIVGHYLGKQIQWGIIWRKQIQWGNYLKQECRIWGGWSDTMWKKQDIWHRLKRVDRNDFWTVQTASRLRQIKSWWWSSLLWIKCWSSSEWFLFSDLLFCVCVW